MMGHGLIRVSIRVIGGYNPAMISRLILLLVLLPSSLLAQTTQEKIRDYRKTNEHQILKEFTTLLALPNVASNTQNIRKNAALIMEMMKQRGLNPRLLEGSTPEAPPSVYGEWKVPGAQRTILLYAHFDGQPTDPKQWTETEPWQPTFRTAAIEAGGQIMASPRRELKSIRNGGSMRAQRQTIKPE